jgi:deoxyribodipyrimidine photo-lyase
MRWCGRPHTSPTSGGATSAVREGLEEAGLRARAFAGRLLHEPEAVCTGSGGPYRVFTPFWKKLRTELDPGEPLPVPRLGPSRAPEPWPESVPLDALALTPRQQDGVDWGEGMRGFWTPGESAGAERLAAFVEDGLLRYPERRNRPDLDGSSRLSPHLHWGEVSPRQVWRAAEGWVRNGPMREAADAFLAEIGWREFAYHVLHHFPETPTEPLKPEFGGLEWREDGEALEAWRRGRTGYPIVDAGMRQLWALGWMHNRVRMLAASFLTKHLLLPWQEGSRWFWDTLVDADLANNTMGWQWTAGSGADAQPFFRVFNPVTQGERFDPEGAYVRRWVPELAGLPDRYLHRPWEAPEGVLAEAGVALGETYPRPVVDHAEARRRALDAFAALRKGS